MPGLYNEEETRVLEAVAELELQKKPNFSAAARKYRVPIGRVRRRFFGSSSKIDTGGCNKVLSDAQEQALCLYIDRLDELGAPIRQHMLAKAANSILKDTGIHRKVGPRKASRFLKRHSEYRLRKQNPLAADRKNTHDPAHIQKWYTQLQAVDKFGIQPGDIYNMDETGFRIA
jgi:hypothetical protein